MRYIRLKSENQAGWFVTVCLCILVLFPLIAVLAQIYINGSSPGRWGFAELLLDAFRRPLWQHAIKNSLVLSISTAVIGTIMGAGLAIIRSRWEFPTAKWLDVSIWLLLVTPSFIIAQGWLLFASGNGIATQLNVAFVGSFIFHPVGLIFILVLSKFPLAYLAVNAAMEWHAKALTHATKLTSTSWRQAWMWVHIPLLKPAIISGAALIFVDTIGDFGIPAAISSVYRYPTLPYTIYSAIYSSPIRFDMAGVLSLYLLIIIAVVIVIQFFMLRGARYDTLSAGAVRGEIKQTAIKGWGLACCNLLFLLVAVGIPIGSTVYMSFVHSPADGLHLSNITFQHYADLLAPDSRFSSSLLSSFSIALPAALVGLLLGAIIAYVIIFSPFRYKRVVEALSLVTMAVPGVVLGVGYIFVWNQKWLEPYGMLLYGTPVIVILASIAGSLPITTRIISGMMAAVPRHMLDAAQLQGASLSERVFFVLVPLCRSALVTAGLTAFGSSMFNLALHAVLFPPGELTLPLLINRAFENMKFGYASAATMLAGVLVTAIIAMLNRLLNYKMKGVNHE